MMALQTSHNKVKVFFVHYIGSTLQLLGLLILFFIITNHFLHAGTTLSHMEKYLYITLSAVAGLALLAGFGTLTRLGRKWVARLARISESEMMKVRPDSIDHLAKGLVLLTTFGVIFMAYLDSKYAVIHLDASRFYNDTRGYVSLTNYDLSDIHFWSGSRPFTLPLVFKICGYTASNFEQQDAMERVSRCQSSLSILSWSILAAAFSLGMKRYISKVIAFTLVLFLGASLYVTQWDRSMLAESVSTSFMVLVLGFLVMAAWLWDKRQAISNWIQAILWVLLLFAAIFYSFSRDTNVYSLLAVSGLMIVGLFFSSVRTHPMFRFYLTVLVSFLIIFLINNMTTNVGKRYQESLFHVVIYRVIPQQESLDYFRAHGMPYQESYLSLQSLSLKEIFAVGQSDKSVQPLFNWTSEHGKSVLTGYLLSRPVYALSAPFRDIQQWVNSCNNVYRKIITPTSMRINILSTLVYPLWNWLPALFLALLLICIGVIWKDPQRGSVWFLVLILFATVYPLALLCWHTDTNDLERHAFQISLQLRLAAWMMFALVLERGFDYVQERKKGAALTRKIL
jgi:hypothetical protein